MSVLKASVIVPAYNAATTLEECLAALTTQQGEIDLEIIVVNDGSTDETVEVVRRYPVQLVQQPHRGAAAARNTGVSAARPDSGIILFTDADCVPDEFWAERLVRALERAGAEVAGVKGAYRTRQKSAEARFVQTEFEERYDRFTRQKLSPDFADTYAAAYRREILEKYPFDESLPGAIVEDAELGWRLRQKGYCFGFAPDSIVYHRHPDKFLSYFRRKFRIGRWRVSIYRRYPGQLSSRGHTSRLSQVQMLLLALSGATLFLGLVACLLRLSSAARRLFRAGTYSLIMLQLSYVKSLFRTGQKDRTLIGSSWLMLNVRTLALASGAIAGVGQVALEKLWRKGRA